jgi:inosine-uridine nucleoside N-ribohydrolase
MSVDQTAINARALIAAAAKLEAKGYDGDAYAFVEGLILAAIADGYRRIEPIPDLRGPSSTKAGREAARQIFEQTRKQQTGAGHE